MGIMQIFWGGIWKREEGLEKIGLSRGVGVDKKYLNEPYPQEVLKLAFYKVIC